MAPGATRPRLAKIASLAFAAAIVAVGGACRDRGHAIPVERCAGFSFVAANDDEAAAARKLMYASAIEFGLRFEDNSFGTLAPRAEILWSSDRGDRLVLAGYRNRFTKRTDYSVLFLIGDVAHYRYPIATCGRTPEQFGRLRAVFSERWQVGDEPSPSAMPAPHPGRNQGNQDT
jgi:hypothetical protein